MIAPSLAAIEADLRRAAARRAYADVERLAATFGAAATREARALPPGDPQIREIAAWLDRQLDCALILLRTARAAQAEELRRLPFVKDYLRRQASPPRQVSLDL